MRDSLMLSATFRSNDDPLVFAVCHIAAGLRLGCKPGINFVSEQLICIHTRKLMRLFLPDMVDAKEGRILNVVSAAAFQPTVHHATYGASKAFVQSLSQAVNQEIKGTGVKVFTLNPSYTSTPLLKGGGFPERIWWYMISGLSDPKVIAHKGMKAFKSEKTVYIPGLRNWFIHSILIRLTPRSLVDILSYWALRERR